MIYKKQKQPPRDVLKKRYSEIIQQIYGRNPMPKCGSNKIALQFCCDHTLACLFCCKFDRACPRNKGMRVV